MGKEGCEARPVMARAGVRKGRWRLQARALARRLVPAWLGGRAVRHDEPGEEVAHGGHGWEGAAGRGGEPLAWLAVALAAGAGLWFVLPLRLPVAGWWLLVGLAGMVLLLRALAQAPAAAALLAMALAGYAWAGLRAAVSDVRLLPANAGMQEISGRILRIWPHAPGRLRMVLAVEDIPGVRRRHVPQRVRITLLTRGRGEKSAALLPGERIGVRALLSRLPQPVQPGGYDPARRLWREGIGAVAFARASALRRLQGGCAGCSARLRLARAFERLRRHIARRIHRALGQGRAAALAVALLTGARGELSHEARRRLRAAGLAHILAISGLHMSFVFGAVFWLVRAVLAAFPALALRWPVKKMAVLAALAAALGYMLLSGNSVATRRAFIMLAVMALAMGLDRPAITMRNLALAALALLVLSPHMAPEAGFQMSFLAVMGLIAVFEALRGYRRGMASAALAAASGAAGGGRGMVAGALRAVAMVTGGLALSTLVAGAMTALPAAWHFNAVAAWGLAGNLVALPLLTMVVMPAGLVALALMPAGLEGLPLHLMGQGLEGILWWSDRIAALPGAVVPVAQMRLAGALLMAAGLVTLCLRRDAWRLAGAGLLAAGMAWPAARGADVLFAPSGRVAAVRGADGRLTVTPGRAGAFEAARWLRRDGDGATPKQARLRPGWACGPGLCRARAKGLSLVLLKGGARKGRGRDEGPSWRAAVERACAGADIVLAAFPLRGACGAALARVDRFDLWRDGAHDIFVDGARVRLRSAGQERARFPWGTRPLARRLVLMRRREPAAVSSRKAAVAGTGEEAGAGRRGAPALRKGTARR